MPIILTPGAVIPNNPGHPNQNQQTSAQNMIARLTYADLWRGAGTLYTDGTTRLDMQGNFMVGPVRMYNLQVQINGLQGNSTIAHANVANTIQTNDPPNQVGATRFVISALNQSLDTMLSFTVTGTSP